MTNRDDGHATKSSSVKTLFAMVITRILFGYGGAVEDLLGQGKIQAVLFKIAFAFGFCPCVVHSLHYIYERMYLIALIRCKKGDRSLFFLFCRRSLMGFVGTNLFVQVVVSEGYD